MNGRTQCAPSVRAACCLVVAFSAARAEGERHWREHGVCPAVRPQWPTVSIWQHGAALLWPPPPVLLLIWTRHSFGSLSGPAHSVVSGGKARGKS